MASSKFRRALGAVKDQTSIGLAKVGSSASLADLDIAIVKATRHEEYPTEEKYIREILSLTCYSREFISACINTISRRLNKTKNWIVALKTLMLVQRLLSEGDPAYEQEIFFSTRRGTRFLNMSDFRDTSRSNSWDYSAFVRTYALYLDERLEFRMQSRRGKRSAFGFDEDEFEDPQEAANNFTNQQSCPKATPVHEMKADKLFSRMQHLQQLLERFLACRPTGVAKNNRIVIMALYPIVKESFQVYYDITEIMGILIDRFMELEIPDCAKVYEIFCRIGKQFDELDMLYGWCKQIGISRSSEYPEVERITPKKLEVMDEYIRDKSALAQGKRSVKELLDQQKIDEANKDEESNHGEDEEEDMNAMKALPPPEGFVEENNNKEIEPVKEEEIKKPQQEEGDLLNLGEHAVSSNEHADKLALALFNGATEQAPAGPPAWEAFANEADWETALVQSASHLSNQKASLGGGFDLLLLDGLYQQAEVSATMAGPGYGVSGSASSVALGSAGRPAMLALPAPPSSSSSSSLDHPSKSSVHVDPFAASLVVPPPSYVQMSDLERKQKLLMDEQLMWHQYARDGMQGQIGLTKLQHNPHHNINMGGYTHTY